MESWFMVSLEVEFSRRAWSGEGEWMRGCLESVNVRDKHQVPLRTQDVS